MSAESFVESIPAGYKQTEVGVIPEDWKVKSIAEIAPLQRGFDLPTSQLKDGPYPVVYSNGVMNYHESAMVRGPGVTTGRSGTLGKVHYIETDYWPHNTSLWVTRFNGNNPLFIFYLYTSIGFERFSSGSGVPTLNRNDAHSFHTAIPSSVNEQEAIATALSDTDALIESLEQLIAKKRQIKRGAMQELLTGKRRLPGFSGGWEVKCVGDVLKIAHGRSQHAVEDQNGIYPILATGGQIVTSNQFLYDKPSVLIGRKGTIDKPQFMDTPFWTVDTLFYSIIFEPNNAKFLYYRFCLIDWKQYNEASGVPSLNARTIERIELKIPSSEEQTAIATILSDMDSEITLLEEKLGKTRQIKQGMMQELLTGRIRLV